MLIDIYKQPNSPEAPKSRAYIDRILAISGPDGGVVGGDGVSRQRPLRDGGREAWDVIRRLRERAWRQAGLDPQIFWTEQDHIQAGLASPEKHSKYQGYTHQNPPTTESGPASLPSLENPFSPVTLSAVPSTGPNVVPQASDTASASTLTAPMVPLPEAQQARFHSPGLPSMTDPNPNFDWDEWDAVFGPLVPVSDELMEVDAASEFQFAHFM